MYFPDLSPYTYQPSSPWPEGATEVVNVGWLDPSHDFPKGRVEASLIMAVLRRCLRPVNRTRGVYISPFLVTSNAEPDRWYRVTIDGQQLVLGSAEIWLRGEGGRWYAAPNLIYHYIRDLDYLPPKEFLDALARAE